jgi:hypothetical protein
MEFKLSEIKLINQDNMVVDFEENSFDLIYSDMIYEDKDNLEWLDKYWKYLKVGAVYIVQTDFHSVFEVGMKMKSLSNSNFLSKLSWKNEWGKGPSKIFHYCYDDIIIFSKGKEYNFYREKIQVPKVTTNKGLNPSGRQTKTATAFIADICLTTTAKERIFKPDGHLVKWQKPIKLFDRICGPFLQEGQKVLDNYMGVASLGEWCYKNNMDYVGIEYNPSNNHESFKLAQERMDRIMKENN